MFRTADKMPINPPPPPAGNSIIINAWGDCLQPMSCHSIETCLVVEHKEHCPVTARRWNTTTDESLLRPDRPAGRKSSSHCYTRTISHWKSKIRSRPRSSSLSSISRMGGVEKVRSSFLSQQEEATTVAQRQPPTTHHTPRYRITLWALHLHRINDLYSTEFLKVD